MHNSYVKFMPNKKLHDRVERAGEGTAIDTRDGLRELFLNLFDKPGAGRLTLDAERCDQRFHSAPVAGIVDATHEPVRFQTIDQLGDVRSHTGHFRCTFAKAYRPAGAYKMRERAEFRHRQSHFAKRF